MQKCSSIITLAGNVEKRGHDNDDGDVLRQKLLVEWETV